MTSPPLGRMLDAKTVEQRTGITVQQQQDLRDQNLFCRWYRIGRKVYYSEAELGEWLQDQAFRTYHYKVGAADG